MKKIFITLLFILLINYISYSKDAGTTSANFLKIGVGARSAALGGAYTAVNNSIYSLYWNPAGISEFDNITVTGMHNKWVENINYNFIGIVIPAEKWKFGFSAAMLSMDDIEKTIESAGTYQKIGSFSPKDYCVNISAAKQINKKLNTGITLKYINSELDNKSADAIAIDAGIIYKPEIKNLQLGLSIRNFGTKLKYISEKEDLPLNITLGGQYNIFNNFIILTDINKYIDNDIQIHSGIEYVYDIVSLRIGYNSLSDLDNGFTGGIGLKINELTVDYAFEPQGDFGDVHRFSLTYKFE